MLGSEFRCLVSQHVGYLLPCGQNDLSNMMAQGADSAFHHRRTFLAFRHPFFDIFDNDPRLAPRTVGGMCHLWAATTPERSRVPVMDIAFYIVVPCCRLIRSSHIQHLDHQIDMAVNPWL